MTSPRDDLGWDVDQHGRMRDYADTDDAVTTEPFDLEDEDD